VIDLPTAAKMVAVVGLNASGILERVANGRLRACWHSKNLGDLRFTKADIKACVEQIQVENQWVRREEIAARMGVKVTVVTKWVNAGLLTPVATHANTQHFSRDEVEAFVHGHLFSDEATRILKEFA
jgi:hypothetical protein